MTTAIIVWLWFFGVVSAWTVFADDKWSEWTVAALATAWPLTVPAFIFIGQVFGPKSK